MQERRLAVYRTARYYTSGAVRPDEVWVVCHGYGQLARRFLRHFEPLAAEVSGVRRLIIAPEGLSRFYLGEAAGGHQHVGASWMTRDGREDEIDDYVRWLDTAYADALMCAATPMPSRLVVVGFSQGCATAARWLAASAMLPAHRCDRLLLWGGALPPDLDLQAHAAWLDRRLKLIAGDADPYLTPERVDAERTRLDALGIGYEYIGYAGGHQIDRDLLVRLAAESTSEPGET
jgi:predicted esterase